MKKFIILDRDGVINYDSVDYIKSPDEWHAIPGSLEAIADLNHAGFSVLVVTNQSGIARGYYDANILDLIHEKMFAELAQVDGHIKEVLFCPHHPEEHCRCRKPKPGLLLDIQKKYAVNLAEVFLIGDKVSDVQAARAAGCKPLLVATGLAKVEMENVPQFANLAEAVEYVLLKQQSHGRVD